MGFFTGGEPKESRRRDQPPAVAPAIDEEAATRMLERSLRMRNEDLLDLAEGQIYDLQRAFSDYRFHGVPIEEVIRCLSLASGSIAALAQHEPPTST